MDVQKYETVEQWTLTEVNRWVDQELQFGDYGFRKKFKKKFAEGWTKASGWSAKNRKSQKWKTSPIEPGAWCGRALFDIDKAYLKQIGIINNEHRLWVLEEIAQLPEPEKIGGYAPDIHSIVYVGQKKPPPPATVQDFTDKWKCTKTSCGFGNRMRNAACTICDTQRPPEKELSLANPPRREQTAEEAKGKWLQYTDDETQKTYYYNSATKQSFWDVPAGASVEVHPDTDVKGKPGRDWKEPPTVKRSSSLTGPGAEVLIELDMIWMGFSGVTQMVAAAEGRKQMQKCRESGAVYVLRETPPISRYYDCGPILGTPGAFGVVRHAESKSNKQAYACKIMQKFKYKNAQKTLDYFNDMREEIHLMAVLKQLPGIIQIVDVFEDLERLFIVMEECKGGELLDYINSGRGRSEREVAAISSKMFQSLSFLHARDIVHRDLKPENFLLKTKNPEDGLRLIDFGTSKVVRWREHMGGVTGSAYYLAPEVLDEDANTASDVWSLGVITFMLMFGFPPFFFFEDPSALEPVYELIRVGFTPEVKSGWGPWFPESRPLSKHCMDFIDRCLRTDVAERLTCEEALEHPFLSEKQSSKGIRPCNAAFINSLSCFKKNRSHLQEDLLEMLISCHYLTKDQEDTVKKTFAVMDKNGDGVINQMELQMSLRAVDPNITEQDAKSIMLAIDVNKDGTLSYHEVLEARINRKLMSKESRLRKLFDDLDQDQSGALNADELREALNHVENRAEPYTMNAVKRMMVDVDRDHDGMVEYEEFIDMWAGRKKVGEQDSDRRMSMPIDVMTDSVPKTPLDGYAPAADGITPWSPRAADGGAAFVKSYGPDTNPAFGGNTLTVGQTAIATGDDSTLISLKVAREGSLRDADEDPFQVLEPLQQSPTRSAATTAPTVSTVSSGKPLE